MGMFKTSLSQNLDENNDQAKIEIIKSLCWLGHIDMAKSLVNSLDDPEKSLNTLDKIFLKDVLNMSFFSGDEA